MSQQINDRLVRHVSTCVGRLQVAVKRNEFFFILLIVLTYQLRKQ
jgi:hypothetical protein